MVSRVSLQDVIRCDICETPVPTKHCDVCHIHLCEECEGRHLSDESKEHVIVSFEMRGSTPKCTIHLAKICTRYCKKCNTRICALCDSLGKHKRHETEHISKMADGNKEPLKKELKAVEKFTFPKLSIARKCNKQCCCVFSIVFGFVVFCFGFLSYFWARDV